MLVISNSRLNLFRRCHYAHYNKYHLKLIPKRKGSALQRGSMFHECLEHWNNGKSWKKALKPLAKEYYENNLKEEIEADGDMVKLVERLMTAYTDYYSEEDVEYLVNELHFQLPLVQGVEIQGYIDAVIRGHKGHVWGREYKTFKRIPDREMLIFNQQSGIYTWALGKLGYNPKGMSWNIIKAKNPTKPKILQSGKLSQAALDSTPTNIRLDLIEMGFNPDEYVEFINKAKYENYFFNYEIRFNKSIVRSIMKDTKETAKLIRDYTDILKDKNLSKDCSWCNYKNICQAELLGLDVDYVIKSKYQIRGE